MLQKINRYFLHVIKMHTLIDHLIFKADESIKAQGKYNVMNNYHRNTTFGILENHNHLDIEVQSKDTTELRKEITPEPTQKPLVSTVFCRTSVSICRLEG